MLFVTHAILMEADSPNGYLLLQVLHIYLTIDAFAAMEVHTEDTIKEGRSEIATFKQKMDVCSSYQPHLYVFIVFFCSNTYERLQKNLRKIGILLNTICSCTFLMIL
jgi:hypothetical protein